MQETFEHNISQQLGDFKLQPSPTVWQEVDAALHPERKRRFIIWWWLGAALIIFGAMGYWVIFYQANNTTKQLSQNNGITQPKTITKQQQLPQKTTAILPTQTPTETTINKHFNIDKEVVIKTAKQQKTLMSNAELSEHMITYNSLKTLPNNPNDVAMASDSNTQQSTNNTLVTTITNPITTTETTNPTDSIIIKPINQNSSKPTDTNTTKTNKKVKQKKSLNWLVTVGTGTLQTGIESNFNKAIYSSSATIGNPTTGSGTGSISNPTPAITDPKIGYNVQLGIAYKTQLSKHWQLQTGLQYRYLSNQHGLKNDTAALYPNSYIADDNNFITNKAHWLQMPLTFVFSFQPSKKNKVSILMGTSLAYALSEKWLISNTNTGRFYYNASANNKWLLGLQSGLSYSFNQKLTIAALLEYTLSPIHNNVTDKYHFVQYNLQIATPISFKHKLFTKK